MHHTKAKSHFMPKGLSLVAIAEIILLFYAQACLGHSKGLFQGNLEEGIHSEIIADSNSNTHRVRRTAGTAIGYGRGVYIGEGESSKGRNRAWGNDRMFDEANARHATAGNGNDFEFDGVIGFEPEKHIHYGERSGSASGKNIVFGEGYSRGSGSRGQGIKVKEGYINGQGVGIAIDNDDRVRMIANGDAKFYVNYYLLLYIFIIAFWI